MCNEHYRRRREADESRAIWQEFEGAQPADDVTPPMEAAQQEPSELREAVATPER